MFKNKNKNMDTKTLLLKFNNFTHIVEKFVEHEKKEISKIIKDFWAEHYITDLLKISFILFLLFWFCFLIYYDAGYSHITFDEYVSMQHQIDKSAYENQVQEKIIAKQAEKIQQLSNDLSFAKMQRNAAWAVLGTTFSAGVVTGYLCVALVLIYKSLA